MQRFAAASLVFFLTLPFAATAQVQAQPITPDQRMQLGTVPDCVVPSNTGYVAGTFNRYYPGYSYPSQYAPPPDYYSPDSSPPPVNSAPVRQPYQQRRGGRGDSASSEFAKPTVLVFRDGHRQEVANYAITGPMLFVLSGARSRIAIAELDIPATEQVNRSRGVEFHVPGTNR